METIICNICLRTVPVYSENVKLIDPEDGLSYLYAAKAYPRHSVMAEFFDAVCPNSLVIIEKTKI